jgi:hypothetical protein
VRTRLRRLTAWLAASMDEPSDEPEPRWLTDEELADL